MAIGEAIDLSGDFGPDEFAQLEDAIGGDQVAEVCIRIEQLLREAESGRPSPQARLRAGAGAYLLGRHLEADRFLGGLSDATACYVHGLALTALRRPQDAAERFAEAAEAGYDAVACALKQAGAVRAQGRLDDAEALLRQTGTDGARRAEYSFQMGCILADRGDTFGAIEYFERAVDMDPQHSQALFWLAGKNSLHGNDAEAIRLYEQSLSRPPYHLGSLLNLGLMYEDQGNLDAAAFCFHRILKADPTHSRARMYLQDIQSSQDMFFDEDAVRNEARLQHLLARPIADFELSARSRNCLAQMGINSLGELARTSESELLGGKNFGETSLDEVRDLMASHGLTIGQFHGKPEPAEPVWSPVDARADIPPEEQALLNRSVAELNLSVRARKCMSRLGISTLGELVSRTPDELLSTKNFGVTSLNEIRTQLQEVNLSLRND